MLHTYLRYVSRDRYIQPTRYCFVPASKYIIHSDLSKAGLACIHCDMCCAVLRRAVLFHSPISCIVRSVKKNYNTFYFKSTCSKVWLGIRCTLIKYMYLVFDVWRNDVIFYIPHTVKGARKPSCNAFMRKSSTQRAICTKKRYWPSLH